ncbi:unnamed protein product [Rotaria sp. Silwood2]|nr:unnamed protein product [Rotaria sp. Silwood2]
MPSKSRIWCAHPYHDEVLPNGKKRFSKIGAKPSHPKGKRLISEQLAEFINNHNEAILNGSSKQLSKADYLCSPCFVKERNRYMSDEQADMHIDDSQGSFNYDNLDSGSDSQQNSPMDDDYVRLEQEDAKLKLNQVFELNIKNLFFHIRNTKQIANAVDETYFKLKEFSNILLPRSRHNNEPRTLSSLDLSTDDAIWILDSLRELFSISDNNEQQRLMTMLPPEWGRYRISNWFRDRRGNKPLDNQIELAVYNFYTSDEVSRETSYKKQVIHPPPFRTPVPLRFLHLTIGETFEQFKMKYPNMEISRSKLFSLRPTWVRERTPHESSHHHQDFQIEASWPFSSSGHVKGPCDGVGAVVKLTATQHLLKGGPNASFSTPKQFFEWCLEKNDRMVVARSPRIEASNCPSTYMSEPNRPIEVRWLSADVINNEFENRLMPRWNLLSSKSSISGIRDIHQFDADKNGSVSCRRTSQSSTMTNHTFKIQTTVKSTLNQVLTLSDCNNGIFIIIKHQNAFRLAQMNSSDLTISQITVTCFDPPFPASIFNRSKSPRLFNLTISTEQFRARLIDNPEQLLNGHIRISPQQLLDIQNIWDEE